MADVAALPTTFVAVGDSFTEGLEDELGPDGRHRGWADRIAEALARQSGALRYANLAVRGRLVDQVVREQVPVAVDLRPDLVSFHAGGNDVLRPGVDVADVLRRYEDGVRVLHETGATVLLFTVIERAGGTGRLADRLARRFAAFNAGVRAMAERHGARLTDVGAIPALQDRRLWHEDRLHLNPEGHRRVAAAVLDTLGVSDEALLAGPAGWWREELELAPTTGRFVALSQDLRWVRCHLLPWVMRRVRGVSSGDDVVAKRVELSEILPR